MRLPTYSKYRASKVNWLGSIPEEWEVLPFKRLAQLAYGDSLPDEKREDGPVAVFGSNGVVGTHTKSNTKGPCFIVGRKGSFGKVVYSDRSAFAIDTTYFVDQTQTNEDIRWLYYVVTSLGLDSYSRDSAVPGLSRQDAYSHRLPHCSKREQRAIADYLGRATAKIDALIEKKQRFIELLEEKRAALITQAVTGGLDPAAPMKETGIPWLARVPAHWQVKRLKHVSPAQTVGIVVNPSTFVADEGKPFLVGGDVSEGGIDWKNAKRISEEGNRANSKSILREGDLVVVRVGYPGTAAVVPKELDGGNCASMVIVRRHNSFDSAWLSLFMNSGVLRAQIEIVQYGAAQKQFNVSHAVDFQIAVPPLSEQIAIRTWLHAKLEQLEALSRKVREATERLSEMRSALITAAVTGKIDVREASAMG